MKNHQCARLTRWVLKLTEYDFEILHRPGKKHAKANVLSPHVADAVCIFPETHDDTEADMKPLMEVSLTKEAIMQAQTEDRFCQQICQALLEGENLPYFSDQDSVLYRMNSGTSGKPTVVVPISLREQVIQQHHSPVFVRHQGEKRTSNSLWLIYYWPSMTKDV